MVWIGQITSKSKFYFLLNSMDSNTDIVPQIIGYKNLSNGYSILVCFEQSGLQREKKSELQQLFKKISKIL